MTAFVLAAAGAALTSAFFAALLRKENSEYAMALRVAAGAFLLFGILQAVLPALQQITALLKLAGVGGEYSSILLRALGVAFLTQFAADACRDAGESALAGRVELTGRVGILVLALPLFARVASIAAALVGK